MISSPITSASEPTAKQWLWGIAVGLFTFVGVFLLGMGLTLLVIWSIPPNVPHPTEAYEGIGDALRAEFIFLIGVFLSFILAFVFGLLTIFAVPYRLAKRDFIQTACRNESENCS